MTREEAVSRIKDLIESLEMGIEAIESNKEWEGIIPNVQPKMGRWIMPQMDDGMSDPVVYQVRCSVCKWDVDPQIWYEELAHAFCPNCGAKLEGGNG